MYRQRLRVALAIDRGLGEGDFTLADYNEHYAPMLGDLNYEDPDPPAVADLDNAHQVTAMNQIHVEDGDTIHVYTNDGQIVPFRLMGINTPEKHQQGYDESKTGLRTLIQNAFADGETITLGAFDPGKFGTTQEFRSDQGGVLVDNERIFGWLYVGDYAVYNPDAFTSVDPRGQRFQEEVPDYRGMLNRARTEGGER